eukprot:scaffold129674_cov66-Phaeocystis_antarctica.AAC.12
MFGLLGEVLGKSSAAVAIFAAVFLPFLLMHAYMYTQKKERHKGVLTAAVMDQARRGKIGYISSHHTKLAKSVAERVARELLGAGCSLLELDLIGVSLNGTWVETFGEAAVCSEVLRELWLGKCKLRGPLPVMRLPALQLLNLTNNELTGHINPLQGCTALQRLDLSGNNLRGGLEGLKGCVALRVLHLNLNQLIGGLDPLEGCKALTHLWLHDNQLTGGLEPLKGCTALQDLRLSNNKITGGLDALEGLAALKMLGRPRAAPGLQGAGAARLGEQPAIGRPRAAGEVHGTESDRPRGESANGLARVAHAARTTKAGRGEEQQEPLAGERGQGLLREAVSALLNVTWPVRVSGRTAPSEERVEFSVAACCVCIGGTKQIKSPCPCFSSGAPAAARWAVGVSFFRLYNSRPSCIHPPPRGRAGEAHTLK